MTQTVDAGGPRFAPSARTLLSALAIAAALPPWGFDFLLWVALVPWLDGLRRAARLRHAFAQGFWLAFGVGLLVAPWVAVAIREFTAASWSVAIPGLLAFAALLAQPQLPFFALLLSWAGARWPEGAVASLAVCAGLAFSYTGLDSLVPRLFDVGLGYGLHDAKNLRQLAELGGVPLLTTLVVAVNLLLLRAADAWRQPRATRGVALSHAVAAAMLPFAAWGYGHVRVEALQQRLDSPERTLLASIVQGNVPNSVRLAWAAGDDRAAERQLSAYTGPTETIIAREERPDFVVWPEATFPGIFGNSKTRAQRGRSVKFDRQVLRLGAPIAFGAYDAAAEDPGDGLHNALLLINPDYERPGRLGFLQRYHKHLLLPFAETLPGLSEGSWIHRRFPTLGFFTRGEGPVVLRLSPRAGLPVQVSPIICSESLDASHVAAGARLGSQLILNIGSDGWFGSWGEPEFHLAIARMRSVETRLPQVRAANTGISALILPDGEIPARTALGTAAVLDVEIPIEAADASRPTPFTRFGYAFGHAAGAIGLAFAGLLALAPKA